MVSRMKSLFGTIPYLEGKNTVLRQVTDKDADALYEFVHNEKIYRYLPTFLYEQKYEDVHYVIDHLYTECLEESLIQGIYRNEEFCGLAEFYAYKPRAKHVSIGYRLCENVWGQGIATEVVGLMTGCLMNDKDIEIITASTMIENHASAKALMHNGFELVESGVEEDWGFPEPTLADKWIR